MRESPKALCSHDPSVSQLGGPGIRKGVGEVNPVPREEKDRYRQVAGKDWMGAVHMRPAKPELGAGGRGVDESPRPG